MTTENAIRDHQTWLGYLQPEGLVVSPAALVDAQVYLDRDVADRQRAFTPFVHEIDLGERDVVAVQELRQFLVGFLEWPEDLLYGASPERPVPDSLSIGLPELNETLTPTLALADIGPDAAAPAWVLLVKEVPLGTDLDARDTGRESTWSASVTQKLERLLRETGVPIGLLTNATEVRLLYAPRGENSGSLTFPVQAMTEVAGRAILSAFSGLLSRERLFAGPAEARLPGLLKKSRDYQAAVSKELAGQVLDALYELVRGLQAADGHTRGELLKQVLAEHPDEIYRGILTVLLRLVFLLYAEDRALLPTSKLYADNYGIHGLFTRLRADAQKYPDTMDHRYGAWAQLVALFRAVYGGSSHPQLRMPARRGFLFDPRRFPFLEGRSSAEASQRLPLIADGVIYRVLAKLLLLGGERLSYRTLDVEQIGSVYETIMGFRLQKTSGRTIALKAGKSGGAPVAIDLDALLKLKAGERAKHLAESADLKLIGKAAEGLADASSLDQLLSALERRIARNATPDVLPPGAMVLQPTDERRRSGSHYTPRSFTEPIVRTTLRPILERLGPNPTPEQILDLKVCDIAVGSGAFLVETDRQLGDALLRSWHAHRATPSLPPDEDEVLHARRVVAQRCLYGVDKNPVAVDLTKLSLWLATLAKDHPFTFLDHAIRPGDSLVGLTREQIAGFHWKPQRQIPLIRTFLDGQLKLVEKLRADLHALGDEGDEFEKARLHRESRQSLETVRLCADLVIASFFAKSKDKERDAERQRNADLILAVLEDRTHAGLLEGVRGGLAEGPHPVTPFHWEIEFPEVFARANGGFDAIVGNPPFLGGRRISTVHGEQYLGWLLLLHTGAANLCDLVAHFFRRAYSMLRDDGAFGLLATKTIAEGDTREGGLAAIRDRGGMIYTATRRFPWPGRAAVIVSRVHVLKGVHRGTCELDGRVAHRITAFLLDGGGDHAPSALAGQAALFSKGSQVYGQGFLFDDSDPRASPLSLKDRLVTQDPRNAERILPYVGGEEINSRPALDFSRWAITLSDCKTEAELEAWPDLHALVRAKVKPERDALPDNPSNIPLKRRWWAYQAHRPELYLQMTRMARVLVGSQVTAHLAFAFQPTDRLFSQKLNVFLLDDYASFAILQSRCHEVFVHVFGSTLGETLNYSATDCFTPFPFPATRVSAESAGCLYYEHRAALMIRNNQGLTKTYNRFHDPGEQSSEIVELRRLHHEMDRAVLDAYGWTDLRPTCEFLLDYEDDEGEETSARRRKPWRYRWPDEFRDEVLARLLALNAQRAEAERLDGEAADADAKKTNRKPPKKKRGDTPRGALLDS